MATEIHKQLREQYRAEALTEILLVWEELVEVALLKSTVRYEELQGRAGIGFEILIRRLDAIYYFCKQNELPPLPVLAISNTQPFVGQPGKGYFGIDIPSETEQVQNFDWMSVPHPTTADLWIDFS